MGNTDYSLGEVGEAINVTNFFFGFMQYRGPQFQPFVLPLW